MKAKRLIARFMTLLELVIGMALASLLIVVLTDFYRQVTLMNTTSEQQQKESFKVRYVEHRLSAVLPAAAEKVNGKFYFYTSGDMNGLLADNNPSLVFVFDAGTSADHERSGYTLGRLYLDKQNRLCLATWPEPKVWEKEGSNLPPAHNEVLMEGVKKVQFSFYIAPERDRSKWRNGKSEEKAPKKETSEEEKKEEDSEKPKEENPKPEKPKPGQKDEPTKPPPPPTKAEAEDKDKVEPESKDKWVEEWRKEYKELPAMVRVTVTPLGDSEKPMQFAFPLPNSHEGIIYE